MREDGLVVVVSTSRIRQDILKNSNLLHKRGFGDALLQNSGVCNSISLAGQIMDLPILPLASDIDIYNSLVKM